MLFENDVCVIRNYFIGRFRKIQSNQKSPGKAQKSIKSKIAPAETIFFLKTKFLFKPNVLDKKNCLWEKIQKWNICPREKKTIFLWLFLKVRGSTLWLFRVDWNILLKKSVLEKIIFTIYHPMSELVIYHIFRSLDRILEVF